MNTKLLKQKILDLAIRGKLTQQLKSDGTAKDLLTQISDERRKMRDERKGTRSKKSGVILSEAQSAKSKDLGQIIPLDKSEAPFEIPANWEWVRLGNLCKASSGKTPSTSQKEFWNGNVLWVTSKDVKQKYIDSTQICLSDLGASSMQLYPPKTMIIVGRSGILRHSLPVAILKKSATVNQDLKALVFKDNRIVEFIYAVIKGMEQHLLHVYKKAGTTVDNLNFDLFLTAPIPLPPLAEQQRIVAKIEEAFAEIDAIEKNKELLKTHIKQTRQKILDLAIHGKLVPQNKSDEPAIVLLERISRDNPHYEKLTDVPFEIPDSWEWVKLGDVAYIASGSTPSKEAFVDKGVPYLKMYNLRNQQIDFEYKPQYIKREVHEGKLSRSKAKPGDVIMNIVGPPLGKVALVPESLPECNFNQAAVLIRAHYSSNLTNQYIRYFLLQMDEINAVNTKGTAGQENISLTQTQKMRFPLPPLAEQKRIVNKIEEIFASLDEISRHLD